MKTTTLFAMTTALSLLLAATAPPKKAPPAPGETPLAKTDIRNLQGTWRVMRAENSGIDVKDRLGYDEFIIEGTATKVIFRGEERKGSFEIDPQQKPKWITFTPPNGGQVPAIYELKGDHWKVLSRNAGRPQKMGRPRLRPDGVRAREKVDDAIVDAPERNAPGDRGGTLNRSRQRIGAVQHPRQPLGEVGRHAVREAVAQQRRNRRRAVDVEEDHTAVAQHDIELAVIDAEARRMSSSSGGASVSSHDVALSPLTTRSFERKRKLICRSPKK
jgi:uncharacterized protein (TIGR03067 family)